MSSIHHQLPGSRAKRSFESAGVKTWFAEISAMEYDMIFAMLVGACFGAHFVACSVEYSKKNDCGGGQAEPQKGHFNKRIGRVLEKFNASFGSFAG